MGMYNKEDCFAFGPKGCNALKGWYSGDAGCLGCTFYKTREQLFKERGSRADRYSSLSLLQKAEEFKLHAGIYGLVIDSEKLRARRKAAKLTQKKLAEKAGVSHCKISEWDRGISRRPKDMEDFLNVAQALGCDPGELMRPEGSRKEK